MGDKNMADDNKHLDKDTAELRRRRGLEPLARLDELDGYKVADHDEDIRGWDVFTPDGRKVGKVEEIIVDTSVLKARYMEVKLQKEVVGEDDDRWALIPVGIARLSDDKEVVIDRVPTSMLLTKEERKRRPLDREVELAVRREFGSTGGTADSGDSFYEDDIYDDRRLRRERSAERESYIIRPDEPSDTRI
jgi:photosynthetic reaction center H subunit